ncbi:amidase [Brachybacterium endophyticum]|uniref:Amidase n=1 Tax=Brachybacterium endophyticum TaxID=2182385 RepID=A0A2U2RM84_9MICO|nr:amidase [Brachybacterium endophyticum]PWH06905.1 amidase [Brachybacterium endophyticum]
MTSSHPAGGRAPRPGGEGAAADRAEIDRAARSDTLSLARALRESTIDVREHTEHVLEAARTVGPQVGAFAHLLPERSRAQAEAAAREIERVSGTSDRERLARERPLLGVPMPIKDLSRIQGEPFEAGSAVLRGNRAEVTDGVAQDVLDAGTVTIGKTTTPEFGLPCYTEPATSAPARTPWDTRRTAGGSSGGAAAAVASGIVPIAHGSDGGGSIRIPAACCGIVGLKPSRGLVSPGPHGAEGPGLVTDGVLARTVRDTALGLDLLARVRPGDAFPRSTPAESYLALTERAPRGLRIGLLTDPLAIATDVHPAALRASERAAEALRGLGHRVSAVPAPFDTDRWRTFMPLWTVGAAAMDLPAEAEARLMPLTRWLRARGREYDGRALGGALTGMQQLAREVGEAFEDLDVVLTPTLAGPPAFPADLQLEDPAADFDAQCAFTPWTSTWNMTGRAAMSLPLHRESIEGVELPFGVQLGAVRAGDDELLLALAAQLEHVDPWPGVHEVPTP